MNREKIFLKFGGRCAYCGCDLLEIKNMQVDHVVSQHNFKRDMIYKDLDVPKFLHNITDVNDEKNLFPTCRSCNLYKSSSTLEVFREEIGKQIERLNKNPMHRLAKRFGLIEENPKKIVFYFETKELGKPINNN